MLNAKWTFDWSGWEAEAGRDSTLYRLVWKSDSHAEQMHLSYIAAVGKRSTGTNSPLDGTYVKVARRDVITQR